MTDVTYEWYSHNIWIGLKFSTQENSFVWLSDRSLPSFILPWDIGEPDRYVGCGCNDDCVVTNRNLLWDTTCGERLARVVCETGEHKDFIYQSETTRVVQPLLLYAYFDVII